MEISVEMYGRGWETVLEGVTKNISLNKCNILLHRMAHYIYDTCPTFRIHDITVYQYSFFGCKYLLRGPFWDGVTKIISLKKFHILLHRMAHYIYGTCPTFSIHDITVYQYSLFGCKYLIWRPILEV